jgi:hypothetical protein
MIKMTGLKRKSMRDKRAALEMSVGTIVIIVLAMSMLVLGLILIRQIFSVATGSVDQINDKVRAELSSLFTDESDKVVVLLGKDSNAKVKAGNTKFRGCGCCKDI